MGSHMRTYGYSYGYDQIGQLGPNKDPGPWGLEDSLQKKGVLPRVELLVGGMVQKIGQKLGSTWWLIPLSK